MEDSGNVPLVGRGVEEGGGGDGDKVVWEASVGRGRWIPGEAGKEGVSMCVCMLVYMQGGREGARYICI